MKKKMTTGETLTAVGMVGMTGRFIVLSLAAVLALSSLTGCGKKEEVSNTEDTEVVDEIETDDEDLVPITDDSEKITTLGVEWGASYEDVSTYMTEVGYTIDETESPYIMYAYVNLLDQAWVGKLEFNDDGQLYGYSLALNSLITRDSTFDNLITNIISGFYDQYEYPSIEEEDVEAIDLSNTVIDGTNDSLVYTVPFDAHDITSIIVTGKMEKDATDDIMELYNQMGVFDSQIESLEDDGTYYQIYLAYLCKNYSAKQEGKVSEVDPSQFSEVASDGEDFEALSYYTNGDGYKIVFNPLQYPYFDSGLDLSEYYARVSWDTGLVDVDSITKHEGEEDDLPDDEEIADGDIIEDEDDTVDETIEDTYGDVLVLDGTGFDYLIRLDELIGVLESGEHTEDEIYSM